MEKDISEIDSVIQIYKNCSILSSFFASYVQIVKVNVKSYRKLFKSRFFVEILEGM